MLLVTCVVLIWLIYFTLCHSAGLYIKTERCRKSSYSFKDYLETVVQKGAQGRIEQDQLKKGQGPFQHTRKEAVSMAAKQMASNNPNLCKVSLFVCKSFPCTNWPGILIIDRGWVTYIIADDVHVPNDKTHSFFTRIMLYSLTEIASQ